MNTHEDVDSANEKLPINSTEPDNKFSPSNSDSEIDEIIKSESRIPLKTPLRDGDLNAHTKFSTNDAANGRGKCMAKNAFTSFSGLTKEELLKYTNDPFWIRVRLFLFIFFWIMWLAMFIGAIAIIIMAPKCEVPKKPQWYEQGPLYEMDVAKLVDENESKNVFKRMTSILGYLSGLKIKGIILSPVFKSEKNREENVINYNSIDEKFGTIENFKDFVEEAKKKDIHVILSFVPNHSSKNHSWFTRSVAKEEPYNNYYVWSPASKIDPDGSRIPPNNWLSLKGGSAWEWNEERGEFYLHQFDVDQPDLNFHNPLVLEELHKIFSFWIKLGVKGFSLDKVQYLLEDGGLQDEIPGEKPGAIHTQYEFYSHKKTHNIPAVADILSSWRFIIHNSTDGQGVLMVTGDVPIPTESNSTTVVVDKRIRDGLATLLSKNFTAADLYSHLEKIINSTEKWPAVQLGNRFTKSVVDMFGEESVDGLNMITLLLPATPITYFGEELGLSDHSVFKEENEAFSQKASKESHYKVYEALVLARDSQTILYGNSSLKLLNDSVLAFTRINLGNPGYLVVFNPSSQNFTLDLSTLDFVPKDLMIYTKSIHSTLNIKPGADKIKSKNFYLEPKSAVTFTFAPKIEE